MPVLSEEHTRLRDAEIFDVPGYGGERPAPWLLVDWSQHRHTAMVNGRDINYIEYGAPDAQPLILIHGLAGCWQNWLGNIVGLGERFRVVALDLPGFGSSPLPAEKISLPLFADTVAGLMDHLGIARAHVVGNSMGGMTTLQLALDHPSRVEKLVLVSPAGWSTSDNPPAIANMSEVAGLIFGRIGKMNVAAARRPRLRHMMLRGVAAFPAQLAPETVVELIGTGRNDGFPQSLRAILGHDFRERLPEIESETLLIWGRRDGVITYRDIFGFADAIPNIEWKLIGNAAHVAMVEHPVWFDQTVTDFLD